MTINYLEIDPVAWEYKLAKDLKRLEMEHNRTERARTTVEAQRQPFKTPTVEEYVRGFIGEVERAALNQRKAEHIAMIQKLSPEAVARLAQDVNAAGS